MYRLCFETIMTILYQARSHKVTNKSICNALFSCFGKTVESYDMHREYLRENHPILFNELALRFQLWTYLADINEQAQERFQVIISQMQKAESVTEKMKADNQWEWIQRMGSIHNRAEEIVLNELIYSC